MDAVPRTEMDTTNDSGPDSGGTTVQEASSRYLDSLESGGSRKTIRSPLNEFIDFCDEHSISCVDDLSAADLREYGSRLLDRKREGDISASTADTYFSYVRAFLSFCVRDGLADQNPANTVKAEEYLPKDDGKRKRQFWTDEQRSQLVDHVSSRVSDSLESWSEVSREVAYRDRAIVILFIDTGVRGGELFFDPNDDRRNGLTWGDVHLDKRMVEVFGKSRKYEPVPLSDRAISALETYRTVVDPPSDKWPVFPTGHSASIYDALEEATGERPQPGSDVDRLCREHGVAPPALTKDGGRSILERLTVDAEIEVEDGFLKPHGARRALGADLYRQGKSEVAQSILRHQSIETTHESYSDMQVDDLADEINEIR